MPVIISMLRGVNVGGHNVIKMEELRALYASLKLRDAQTYVQSGNVIFRTDERDLAVLTKRVHGGIERKFAPMCFGSKLIPRNCGLTAANSTFIFRMDRGSRKCRGPR